MTESTKYKKIFLICCVFLPQIFINGCTKKSSLARISIEAKTHQGEPISNATVLLDSNAIGETDTKGRLFTEMSYELGSIHKVEVKKESENYYFAPFIDNILITQEDNQGFSLKAVLYFVPKPRPYSSTDDLVSNRRLSEKATESQVDDSKPDADRSLAIEETSPLHQDLLSAEKKELDMQGSIESTGTQQTLKPTSDGSSSVSVGGVITSQDLPSKTRISSELGPEIGAHVRQTHRVDELAARALDAASRSYSAPSSEILNIPKQALVRSRDAGGEKIEDPSNVLREELFIDNELESPHTGELSKPQEKSVDDSLKNDESKKEDGTHQFSYSAKKETINAQLIGPGILTVYVSHNGTLGDTALAGVNIAFAEPKAGTYRNGCTTNHRGRCVIRFAFVPDAPITLIASKKGYKTSSSSVLVRGPSKHRIVMKKGLTLDLYTLTKKYNNTEGLSRVEVLINNRSVGFTDRYGHHSYEINDKKEAMIAVTLKAPGYLPEVYETDFVVSGQMTIVKYFASPNPPPARLSILRPLASGSIDQSSLLQISGSVFEALKLAGRKYIFSSPGFNEVPVSVVDRGMRLSRLDPLKIKQKGWASTVLKTSVDVLMVPTVINSTRPTLEISLVDSSGQVVVAAQEELDGSMDGASVDRAVFRVSQKINQLFPFEGAVVGKEGDKAWVNIGQSHARGIKIGDIIDVYGVQAEKSADKERHRKIGTITVHEVKDAQSVCKIVWVSPRAVIERGDAIVLRPQRAQSNLAAQIKVFSQDGIRSKAVDHANIYLNSSWIGATDESGNLYVDGKTSGSLRVIKHGYKDHIQEVKIAPNSRLEIRLDRESAFVRIDSKPSGATVFIEGNSVGRTPLMTPIPIPTGFIKLRLESGSGFKPYHTVLELEEGTLDLTGSRSISLETDFMAQAHRLIKSGKNQDATEILEKVPRTHSDYLISRFEAGNLWLSVLNDPEKAEAFFSEVIMDEGVKSFVDKRFIGAHIDLGIAQFQIAETLAGKDAEKARNYYQKVISGLESVAPHLRFVPSDQFNQAVHSVNYYKTLAKHRLWEMTQDPQLLSETVRAWRNYIDGDAKTVPQEESTKMLINNAQVYFKQATAYLDRSRSSVKQ